MNCTLSEFASGLRVETAFDVLAVARKLKAGGKDVVELQIGDSPFPSTAGAKRAGIAAIESDHTRYCPSMGLPSFRETIAKTLRTRYGAKCPPLSADNVVVGPGAKVFEQFFCEAMLNPGDEVLVFTPAFPTYAPNILRRQGVIVPSRLEESRQFRPNVEEVRAFCGRPRAKAIFLNSPHNPTGGIAAAEDIAAIADAVRGKNLCIFSDEPYDYMVWRGEHCTPLTEADLLDQVVAVHTFSKSYSMSGWRLGFAVSSPRLAAALGKMINTALSCVPPFVQLAGEAALQEDATERDAAMEQFRQKVNLLADGLSHIPEVRVVRPAGTFYVFPNVSRVCNRLKVTSHGLAMFLLEAADDQFGVACLGGECFGAGGEGFLRFSCAEPDERLTAALHFLPKAFNRADRVAAYLAERPHYRLAHPYAEPAL